VLNWGDRWPRPRACTTSPPISTATDAAEFPFRRSAASRFASKAAQPVGCPLPASSRPGPDGGASSATRTSKGRSGSTSNVGSSVANPSSNVASTTDVTDVARVSGSSVVTTGAASAPSVVGAASLSTTTVVSLARSVGGTDTTMAFASDSPADGGVRLVGSVSAHAATVNAAAPSAATHRLDPVHRTRP
jgi:hypothetical protein